MKKTRAQSLLHPVSSIHKEEETYPHGYWATPIYIKVKLNQIQNKHNFDPLLSIKFYNGHIFPIEINQNEW